MARHLQYGCHNLELKNKMKQLYYVIQTLLHGPGGNVIKVISLGLGLAMSFLLFSRVAFEQSFDTCFKDYANLYQLWSVYTFNNEAKKPQEHNIGPLAGAIMEQFPEEVEAATSLSKYGVNNPLFLGNVKFDDVYVIAADSLFFRTMGIEVLAGNPTADLQQPDAIYLSERLARQMFPDEENPIGHTLNSGKKFDVIVRGVYKDIPLNSTVRADAVISLPSLLRRNLYNYSWDGGDSWHAYLRLKPEVNPDHLNQRIHLAIRQKLPPMDGYEMSAFLQPIRDTHLGDKETGSICIMLSILAACVLFIMSLNYALISISSLSYRAKAIGVHKCSGAESKSILGMFLWETFFIICLALLVAGILLWGCRDFVEDNIIPYRQLFVPDMIWILLGVIATLFLLGSTLPGLAFSRIPVTQVFRRYTEGRKGWKRPLLFVQFAGVAFIAGLMCIVMLQYHHVLTKNPGYNPERIAYGYHEVVDKATVDACQHFYAGLPYVEEMTSSIDTPFGYSGEFMLDDAGKPLFSTKYDYTQGNYTRVMGIPLLEGKLPGRHGEVAVNETWIAMMHWSRNDVIGRMIETEEGKVKITGILRDFSIGSFFQQPMPFVLHYKWYFGGLLHIRLKEPFDENLQKLNREVAEAFPTQDIAFQSMERQIVMQYHSVCLFRNASIVATIVILFITLMGLIGYVNDETTRRSKEIAIRKINGAETANILKMLSHDIFVIALPSTLLGSCAAWYASNRLLQLFSTVFGSTLPYCMAIAIVTLAVIVGCVLWKSWETANKNPVESIKSE